MSSGGGDGMGQVLGSQVGREACEDVPSVRLTYRDRDEHLYDSKYL